MISFNVNYGSLKGGQRISKAKLQRLMRSVERRLKLKGKHEVSIAFITASAMRRLNESYYGGSGVTDVLAFPAEPIAKRDGYLGEILIYYPRAKSQAVKAGTSTSDEVLLLIAHGMLHLSGIHHDTPSKASRMFKMQSLILKGI